MNPIRPLVIIGAGAAGLMAAIIAARKGIKVVLLERNHHAGLKILATGNGKGNLTHSKLEITHYHSHDPTFVRPALKMFGFQETWHFFEELGLKLYVTEKGRVFPYSREALAIQRVLISEIDRIRVELYLGVEVQEMIRIGSAFEIKMKHAPSIYAQNIILSTGGLAAPQLGAIGEGYQWAAKLGHYVENLFPSLVQLTIHLTGSSLLKKVKMVDVIISLFIEGRVIERKRGDLLFIPRGVSGSAIFDLSRMASEALYQQKKVAIQINFIPDFNREDLRTFFKEKKRDRPEQLMVILLGGILPDKLSRFFLKSLDIDSNLPVGSLSEDKMNCLMYMMTHFYIPITGTQSWKYAQVTCGGVRVSEVNPETMESKIVPHLYFAGEILDVDGDCGGYNLQWAWSSGYLAGKSAAE